jgi:eukaryotic-like serine/threonine-protein kinase
LALISGTTLGFYEVVELVGAGGMGEVYRARDTRLKREVALKVLPASVTSEPDRLLRFAREAEMLAALNHPNIASIYGVEESAGVRALVMELVDGETLADQIARGPIPIAEALPIARQIALALESAHEQGIIHRDLKPANIKLRDDGTVKVLDFGLAKLADPVAAASGSGSQSMSPTITSPALMTNAGMLLGTAAYMSPEQAKGRPADKRSDLWAFGCVLFEMLTGKRAFEGDGVTETLASILRGEPDWPRLPARTPAAVRRLLRRSLTKERRERLDSAADARLDIQEALTAPDATAAANVGTARARLIPWAVAAVTTAAALVLLAMSLSSRGDVSASDQPAMEFEIAPPEGTTFGRIRTAFRSAAISPDGRQLAMIAGPRDGRQMLWIRPLSSNSPRMIAGTENAVHPFWSPDGRWIGFLASGKIKRVDVNGGQPQVLADGNRPGGSFNEAGLMLFARNGEPILSVPPAGASPSALFALDAARKETGQTDPVFLPDGTHLIYFSPASEMGVAYASLDGSVRKFLFAQQNSPADYAPDPSGDGGWLLYHARGALMARRFNPATGDVSGEPVRLVDQAASGPTFSVSRNGVLTFRHQIPPRRELVWFTRNGTQQGVLGEGSPAVPQRSLIGPDGATVAVTRLVDGDTDIYLETVAGEPATRFTFEPDADASPVWSPDGQRIYYGSFRDKKQMVIERPASGLGAERVVLQNEGGGAIQPVSISRDGRWLLVRAGGAGRAAMSFVSVADGKAVPLNETASVSSASMSPDGRWVAYDLRLGSTIDVFVRGVPREVNSSAVDAKRQISAGGASQPVWSRDGNEIFYVSADGMLVSVPVETAGGVFRTGTPRPLFKTAEEASYDVTADGQRFLVNRTVSENDPPVSVIVNWPKLLTR